VSTGNKETNIGLLPLFINTLERESVGSLFIYLIILFQEGSKMNHTNLNHDGKATAADTGTENILTLKWIGRDSWERPVYDDGNGKLYVDVDPRSSRKPDICTKNGNKFHGEPDAPVSDKYAKIIFLPGRDVW
jgi:hypothetical protein